MKRRDDESFSEYKKRRKAQDENDARILSGRLFWNSTARGQYVEFKNPDWAGEGEYMLDIRKRMNSLLDSVPPW
jgi:hypothetical protein